MANNSQNLGTAVNPLQVETNFPDGAVTTEKLASEAVTTAKLADEAVTAAKISAAALRYLGGVGVDASGGAAPATLVGAKVGDKVVGVINATTGATVTADFESVITVEDEIQQSAEDYDTELLTVLLLATGA